MTAERTLYGISGSPFVRRVEIALLEKNLPYELVILSRSDGELVTPEHLARSPHGKVPAFVEGDLKLYESHAIVEYLEDRYPDPALLPADPAARALVRIEELECMLYYGAAIGLVAQRKFLTPPDQRDPAKIEEALAGVTEQAQRMDRRASDRGHGYVTGPAPNRADFTWLPLLELGERAGLKLDAATVPWIAIWRQEMRKRPSCDQTYPAGWRR